MTTYDCGRTYEQHRTPSQWPELRRDGEAMGMEYRTCLGCGSTFCRETTDTEVDDG